MDTINTVQRGYLKEMGRWGRFFGILLAVGASFMFLFSLVFIINDEVTEVANLGVAAWVFAIIYLLLGALYLFLCILLLNASKRLRKADVAEEEEITEGLRYARNYFRTLGIIAIIGLGVLVLAIPVVIVAVIMMAL